jgi:hypothetical protein
MTGKMAGKNRKERSGNKVEMDSDERTALHQCIGFDRDHGLSLLDDTEL